MIFFIISEEPDFLIARFVKAQVKNSDKNDWYLTVEEDLKELGITVFKNDIHSLVGP